MDMVRDEENLEHFSRGTETITIAPLAFEFKCRRQVTSLVDVGNDSDLILALNTFAERHPFGRCA